MSSLPIQINNLKSLFSWRYKSYFIQSKKYEGLYFRFKKKIINHANWVNQDLDIFIQRKNNFISRKCVNVIKNYYNILQNPHNLIKQKSIWHPPRFYEKLTPVIVLFYSIWAVNQLFSTSFELCESYAFLKKHYFCCKSTVWFTLNNAM